MQELEHKSSIIKIITAFYPDAKIYLFGSYARGTAKQGSDIDIAIDVGKRLNLHEHQFLFNLLDALPTVQKIDLVDMHKIPDSMHESILKEGITWKQL
ncbi:MAG TPA: nucleotidyltransferase domain-containing protein [Candidatus Babeliales bacterium]|nr:nucleotidyltransferase domain-containing protein [Candidatus Babeliales bacterium]